LDDDVTNQFNHFSLAVKIRYFFIQSNYFLKSISAKTQSAWHTPDGASLFKKINRTQYQQL
jgi:hypothetical protein